VGYVGGMSMNNTGSPSCWTMWANQCDILNPLFGATNEKLRPPSSSRAHHRALPPRDRRVLVGRDQRPQDQLAQDAAYGRNEANAISWR